MGNRGYVSEKVGGTVFANDVVMHLFVNPMCLLLPFDGFTVHLECIARADIFRFRFVNLVEGEITVFSGERTSSVPVSKSDFGTDGVNRCGICKRKSESPKLLMPQVVFMLETDFQSASLYPKRSGDKKDGLPIFAPSVECPSGFRLVVNRICNDTIEIAVPECLLVVCPCIHNLDGCPWIVGVGAFGLIFRTLFTRWFAVRFCFNVGLDDRCVFLLYFRIRIDGASGLRLRFSISLAIGAFRFRRCLAICCGWSDEERKIGQDNVAVITSAGSAFR